MSREVATGSGPDSQCSAPRLMSFQGAAVARKVSWQERNSSRSSGVAMPEALKKSSYCRIRQYEDFFNASGMATPDDLEEFRSCQLTFRAQAAPWNDMSRGAEHWLSGPDEVAQSLDMHGVISAGVKNEDEGLYPVQHGYWLQTMRDALSREQDTNKES